MIVNSWISVGEDAVNISENITFPKCVSKNHILPQEEPCWNFKREKFTRWIRKATREVITNKYLLIEMFEMRKKSYVRI